MKATVPFQQYHTVRCVKCDTLFPIWTPCPKCLPGKRPVPDPRYVFPQCTITQGEQYLRGENVEHTTPERKAR